MHIGTRDLVQEIWALCNILRDEGITYHQYVNELTYLLFLKMAAETGAEESLPDGCRWSDLSERTGQDQFDYYLNLLTYLGTRGEGPVRQIFANPTSLLRHAGALNLLVEHIDALDWYSVKREGLGDIYEGLLEKSATEHRSGAGQYFTPRPLIESIVSCVKPAVGEVIQDPAAGTGGFLVVADSWIKRHSTSWEKLSDDDQRFQREEAFCGMELVPDTHRLLLMNGLLHGIHGQLLLGDTLSDSGSSLPSADVILTNPPFGNKNGGGLPSRTDLAFRTSNKQLSFLEHVYKKLKPGGRAAVVVPDNVLFEEGQGTNIRADLMERCNLHTILRLPTGIFYAQGVKTNVLFFSSSPGNRPTQEIWVYDLRTRMPAFGKRYPLTRAHFADFEFAFGEDPLGRSSRVDQGPAGRFRCFSVEAVARNGNSLDLKWLPEEPVSEKQSPDPEELAAEVLNRLADALQAAESLSGLVTYYLTGNRS